MMSEPSTTKTIVEVDWDAVYRATYGDLVRYLERKLDDRELAEDLAQEAFYRVLGRSADHPRALLYTVATNLARDVLRSTVRRRQYLRLIVNEDVTSLEAPDVAAEVEHNQRCEFARKALHRLSHRDREVLLLWNAGLTYHEIAAHSGLSIGAIGTTLARARRRLVAAYHELERTDESR